MIDSQAGSFGLAGLAGSAIMIDRDELTNGDAAAVLVTGCATGIGRATVEALDRSGYQVFAGVRRETDAAALRAACSSRTTPVLLDVTDEASVRGAAQQIESVLGKRGIYAIINNAGIAVAGPLEHLQMEQMQRQIDVNVYGVLRVCQTFLPLLRRANQGSLKNPRIINIGSVGGRLALPLLGAYAASKSALAGLTDALRLELRPWNLYVTLVEPGSVVTPIVDKGIAASQENIAALSATARQHYDDSIAAMTNSLTLNSQRGVAATAVARKVQHALRVRKPKARYLVGSDSRVVALMVRYVPIYWRDAMLARFLGLPKRGALRDRD